MSQITSKRINIYLFCNSLTIHQFWLLKLKVYNQKEYCTWKVLVLPIILRYQMSKSAFSPFFFFLFVMLSKTYDMLHVMYLCFSITHHYDTFLFWSGGNILFVGHSVTLDACTRQLRGKPVVNFEQFRSIARGCPYCFVGSMVEDEANSRWCLSEPPVAPLTHQLNNNKQYSWRNLPNWFYLSHSFTLSPIH